MASCLLHCKVCENKFATSESWTRHLFQEYHQEKARLASLKWEEITKKCSLVIYFNSPVKMEDDSNFVMLLWNQLKTTVGGQCKGKKRTPLITDLVWWRERPNIVILQFETRRQANEAYFQIMKRGQATMPEAAGVQIRNFRIGNVVQCKKFVDLGELEWCSLYQWILQDSQMRPQPSTSLRSPPVKKCKIIASSSSVSSCSFPSPTASSPCLVTEFNSLLKSMEVPSSTILEAKQIMEKLKCLMVSKYPSCQFLIFRNIYLKIRHPFCNDLLIFAHGGATPASPHSYLELDIHEIAKHVMGLDSTVDFKIEKDAKYKGSQFFKQGPLDFWVTTDQTYLVEVRLNLLLEYMLTFDPKCAPLLSCVHYFCTLNSCYFGEPPAKGEAIEWLLIFFLSKEKIIPTVRQILEHPHQPIMLPNSERKIDIGFSTDPAFASKWKKKNGTKTFQGSKEEFVSDVLKVFRNLLHFLSQILPNGNFLLNTKDTEFHNRFQLICQPKASWNTKWSWEEMEIIKSHPALISGEISKWPFTIVHPLAVHLNLGYNAKEFYGAADFMKGGVFQLNRFLCQRKRKGSWPDTFNDLQSVLKVQDVLKEEDQKLFMEEAPKLVEKEAPKLTRKKAWKLTMTAARKQAKMEFRTVIRSKAWKEGQKEALKKVGKLARKKSKKEAKSEAYNEAWKKAQREAREKMKLF